MELSTGFLVERLNRFVARVRDQQGCEKLVHVASSGRMTEIMVPGAPVVVRGTGRPGLKTSGTLALVEHNGTWVSVDTAQPGRLLRAALAEQLLDPFQCYSSVTPEYRYGESRIDFMLDGENQPPCLLEVKSVTSALSLPDGQRVALFPDAPTSRGARHLLELAKALRTGYRSAVVFVAQRSDVTAVAPWETVDSQFATTLRLVSSEGVEVYAWKLDVSPERIALGHSIPVDLSTY